MTELSENKINEILSSGVVLVCFSAQWCGPCRMIAPMIDDISKEYEGKATVGKINVDENRETASFYNIMSIPTLLFFKNGQIVDKQIGVVSKDVLRNKINSLL